jgi:hypothetical protein
MIVLRRVVAQSLASQDFPVLEMIVLRRVGAHKGDPNNVRAPAKHFLIMHPLKSRTCVYYKKTKTRILQYKSLYNQGLTSVLGGIIRKVRKLSEQF